MAPSRRCRCQSSGRRMVSVCVRHHGSLTGRHGRQPSPDRSAPSSASPARTCRLPAGLVTSDVNGDRCPLWAGLLTPQGKALFDFIVWAMARTAARLRSRARPKTSIKRLAMYRLRRADRDRARRQRSPSTGSPKATKACPIRACPRSASGGSHAGDDSATAGSSTASASACPRAGRRLADCCGSKATPPN